jgi:hypothetical protein
MTCASSPGALALTGAAPVGEPGARLVIPFDFSKSAIEIDVTIKGNVLHMILDTGVDPSVIDLAKLGNWSRG